MIDETQKPTTEEYREGWERIFGKPEEDDSATIHVSNGDVK